MEPHSDCSNMVMRYLYQRVLTLWSRYVFGLIVTMTGTTISSVTVASAI